MRCEIKGLDTIDCAAWDRHVLGTTGNPTQLSAYARTAEGSAFPAFLYIEEGDKRLFQWLVFVSRKHGFCYISALSEPSSDDAACFSIAMSTLQRHYKPFRFMFYDLALSRFSSRHLLEKQGFSPIHVYEANRVDLTQSEELLFKGIHSKHRNSIRRAEKGDLSFFEGNTEMDVERYYALSEQTYERTRGNNIDRNVFMDAFKVLHRTRNIRFFFIAKEDDVQAAACLLASPFEAIYWKGATKTKEYPGAANLLHWEIMKQLKREGVQVYDFSGGPAIYEPNSKVAGIIRFKQRFGGDVCTYYGGMRIYVPWKNALFELYQKLRL